MARVVIALVVLATAVAPAAAVARPELELTGSVPATVHGIGFHRHEDVRLVLRRSTTDFAIRRVTASATGSFSAAFRAVDLGPCAGFTLTAFGDEGSRVGMHRLHPLHAC
jgi:hypothetical protein